MLSEATLEFLVDLSLNNDRAWFDANKQRYEDEVREPAFALIRAVEPHLHALSPHFLAVAKKTGGSLMRVYRDVRFGTDKRPFKTNVGIHFRHEASKDVHCPGFYLHVEPERSFFGVGLWRPSGSSLKGIRNAIVARSRDYVLARDEPAFRAVFEVDAMGDALKTAPRGFSRDHPLIDDLRKKDHLATAPLGSEQLFGGAGVQTVAELMQVSRPWMSFLTEATGQPF